MAYCALELPAIGQIHAVLHCFGLWGGRVWRAFVVQQTQTPCAFNALKQYLGFPLNNLNCNNCKWFQFWKFIMHEFSQGWQELLYAESRERSMADYGAYIFLLLLLSSKTFGCIQNSRISCCNNPWVVNSGYNSRFYHAFQCEDWVGRVSTLASGCNKNHLEQALLPRYFMGFLGCKSFSVW